MGKLTAANGTGFDLVFVSGPFVQDGPGLGHAAEIDPSLIPNLSNLDPEASELAYDPGNTYSAPYTWGTTRDLLPERPHGAAPSSWESSTPRGGPDGKMTMLGTDRGAAAARRC